MDIGVKKSRATNSWYKAGYSASTKSYFVCKSNQFRISQIIFAEPSLQNAVSQLFPLPI